MSNEHRINKVESHVLKSCQRGLQQSETKCVLVEKCMVSVYTNIVYTKLMIMVYDQKEYTSAVLRIKNARKRASDRSRVI